MGLRFTQLVPLSALRVEEPVRVGRNDPRAEIGLLVLAAVAVVLALAWALQP